MRVVMLAVALCISGCRSVPAGIEQRPACLCHQPAKATSRHEKIPSWAMQALPEDKPREISAPEAVRLSCRRLNIIKHANCVNTLRKLYNEGKAVDPAKCKFDLDKGCNYP